MILCAVSTDYKQAVLAALHTEYRLDEWVELQDTPTADTHIVVTDTIELLPDWYNQRPPILLAAAAFAPNLFTGLLYALLGNAEKAQPLLAAHPGWQQAAALLYCLQQGLQVPNNAAGTSDGYVALHNQAIAAHYGAAQSMSLAQLQACYQTALQAADTAERHAFTAKHYAVLLTDAGCLQQAEELLQQALVPELPQAITVELNNALCHVWMQQLTVPYNTARLENLKALLWQCLQYYEAQGKTVQAGLVLTDAAHIATISNSFSEALGYSSRAITIFENAALPELVAQAQLGKASLLQTWAQQGNPQFFRTAMQAYQAALNVFTRDAAPDIFAEIQHQLGKVYAEIPDEVKKKSVWAAVSVSAFTEALNFYNKIDHPYEFAMICHSFGNAYTKYPAALHSDNFDKALAWYNEALDIRTADRYPLERALTLVNYLEASWQVGNPTGFNNERYGDMLAKAQEILHISQDGAIRAAANEHLQQLALLKEAVGTVN
jgi:tetratricopeptide (TPR) repeat protein